MRRVLLWLPLAAFAALFAVIAIGLWKPADRAVRSAMIGKPMPALALPAMVAGKPGFTGDANGQRRLVNIFASWCIPCAAEAPQLMALKRAGVRIDGIAVRDTPAGIAGFLAARGDPFATIGDDRDGRVQLALGSSGVPESFVVDAHGRIVLQHIGDIRAGEVPAILAAVRGDR